MILTENMDLSSINTMGVKSISAEGCLLERYEDIDRALNARLDLFILGGGSNVLLPEFLNKRTIISRIKGREVLQEDDEYAYIRLGGGERWDDIVQWTLEHGYLGLENLGLIPGTVGAAPIQNIGAYGVELKDFFHSLEAWNLFSGQKEVFHRQDCQFAYRHSVFKGAQKGKYLIGTVVLRLKKEEHHMVNISYQALKQYFDLHHPQGGLTAKDVYEAVCHIRRTKLPDPAVIGNAGSFFKNAVVGRVQWEDILSKHPLAPSYPVDEHHVKIPAGWLIEQCGWKGRRRGPVGVYEKQALVLVNYGSGTSSDVRALAHEIANDVYEEFGIRIEPEVNFIEA